MTKTTEPFLSRLLPLVDAYMRSDFTGRIDQTDTPWTLNPCDTLRRMSKADALPSIDRGYYSDCADKIQAIYQAHINARGYFDLKSPDPNAPWSDPKYSHVENGRDEAQKALIYSAVCSGYDYLLDPVNRQTLLPSFTERGLGLFLLAALEREDHERIGKILDLAKDMQFLAPSPGDLRTGLLAHYVEGGSALSASPWMSCIFTGACGRVREKFPQYAARIDAIVEPLLADLIDLCLYRTRFVTPPNCTVPAYIVNTTTDATQRFPSQDQDADIQHCGDVAFACLYWQNVLTSSPLIDRIRTAANDLFFGFNIDLKAMMSVIPTKGLMSPRRINWLLRFCPWDLLDRLTVDVSAVWGEETASHPVIPPPVVVPPLVDPPVVVNPDAPVTVEVKAETKTVVTTIRRLVLTTAAGVDLLSVYFGSREREHDLGLEPNVHPDADNVARVDVPDGAKFYSVWWRRTNGAWCNYDETINGAIA